MLWCTLTFILAILTLTSPVTGESWLTRQESHQPRLLAEFGRLREVALLDAQQDPESQLFSRLLAPIVRPRYVTSAAHAQVRQHIVDSLQALGWHVEGNVTVLMATPKGRLPFVNIVATHDVNAPRRLVLACHYDSIYGRDTFDAVTDSAVPCAMMLYLANLITTRYLDPVKGRAELTLQLVFFDGEEAIEQWSDTDSLYGSRHMARHLHTSRYQHSPPASQLQRIDLLVLLDLLGAAGPQIYNYIADTNPQFRHLAAVERNLLRERLLLPSSSSQSDTPAYTPIFKYKKSWGLWGAPSIADDHVPFMRRGVKVLHLIPHPFPDVWHTDRDNSRVIHQPTVTNLNRILRVFVLEYLQTFAYQDSA